MSECPCHRSYKFAMPCFALIFLILICFYNYLYLDTVHRRRTDQHHRVQSSGHSHRSLLLPGAESGRSTWHWFHPKSRDQAARASTPSQSYTFVVLIVRIVLLVVGLLVIVVIVLLVLGLLETGTNTQNPELTLQLNK